MNIVDGWDSPEDGLDLLDPEYRASRLVCALNTFLKYLKGGGGGGKSVGSDRVCIAKRITGLYLQ